MTTPTNSPGASRLSHATAAVREGRLGDAFKHYNEAITLDPHSASLRAAFGRELASVAPRVPDPAMQQRVWTDAEDILLDALELDLQDPVARTQIQLLSSARYVPMAPGSPEVEQLLAAGDDHFAANRTDEALRAYEQIVARDPSHWTAAKYVGNCHFVAGRHELAAQWFRHAAALNPRDPQAQRFLCDTLSKLQQYDAMWEAAYATIAAHPRYWSGWLSLDAMRRRAGHPLRSCRFRPAATLVPRADGRHDIACDDRRGTDEVAAWVVHAAQGLKPTTPGATAFQRERAAMATMAAHVREARQKSPDARWPIELAMLQAMDDYGDLDAAVFVLCYREEFCDDFEAWKRADVGTAPDTTHKVKAFIQRAQMRPL